MEKVEFVEVLKANGFKAALEDGYVVVTSPKTSTFKKIGQLAKKSGYTQSYGWRMERGENGEEL